MKTKDIPIFRQKVLDVLPITQAEVGKILGIGSRDVSKLVIPMTKEHLIRRTKVDNTFLLEKNGSDIDKNVIEENKRFEVLLSNGKFSPCCSCDLECDPIHCQKLTEWIMGIGKDYEKDSQSKGDSQSNDFQSKDGSQPSDHDKKADKKADKKTDKK